MEWWVQGLELDTGVLDGETPVHPNFSPAPLHLPSPAILGQDLPVRYPVVQALPGQHSQFYLRHIQPTPVIRGVVDLQPLGYAQSIRTLECLA